MSVNIQITDKLRIRTDPRNWIVEIPREPSGKECATGVQECAVRWKAWGYYPTLSGAVNGLYTLRLRRADAESLEELQRESKRILEEITIGLGVDYKITVEAA